MFRLSIVSASGLCAAAVAAAQAAPSAPQPFIEEQRQQERERALREQQERAVDVRLPTTPERSAGRLPESEIPCFRIDRLLLEGERADDFQWLLSEAAGEQNDDSPLGRCLGTQGVNIVLERLQQALIARGWVTSRVLAAPQDLASGTLRLTLVPGRIAAIRFADGVTDRTSLRTAIPATVGDLPLGLNDLAYVSVNHDLFNHDGQGTSGQTAHYSIPFGQWLLGATASQSKYHQSVAGFSQDYVYAGETRNAELRLSRLMYRDQRRKTTVWLRGFRRASNNFIDDTEIEVQRRVVAGWELGANPPIGTLVKTAKNGDVLLYEVSSNTFAVRTSDGVPRTMFRPNPSVHGYSSNIEFWNAK